MPDPALVAIHNELSKCRGRGHFRTDTWSVLQECVEAIEGGMSPRQHPLGFFMTDLSEIVPPKQRQGELRLHVWPTDYRERSDKRGQIHTHRWNLRSAVLSGSLRNIRHEVVSEPSAKGTVQEVVYGAAGTRMVTTIEGVVARVLGVAEISSGSYYTEDAREFHSSELVKGPAVTVVLAIPAGTTARVFVEPQGEELADHEFVRSAVEPSAVTSILRLALRDAS